MKFSLDWLNDFVDTSAAGGAEGVRKLLDQAGFPVESSQLAGADTILDVEVTPNRPDAMGHRGLAHGSPRWPLSRREISRAGTRSRVRGRVGGAPGLDRDPGAQALPALRRPAWSAASGRRPSDPRRAAAAGGDRAKSISAAVDATSYVLWETAQPLTPSISTGWRGVS
jgi:phenylalanyl-tRNA synthetase beta subunit